MNYVFLLSSFSTAFIRPIALSFLFSTLELRLYVYRVISAFDLSYAFPAIAQ